MISILVISRYAGLPLKGKREYYELTFLCHMAK